MSPLLRSLSFLFLGNMVLLAVPLYAEGPLPLPLPPRPSAENTQLKGLGVAFSNSRVTHPQADSVETPNQTVQIPDRLPPPSPLKQASASFSTYPMSDSDPSPTEESVEDNNEDEYQETYNRVLDKPFYSNKRANNDLPDLEDDKTDTGGWTQKLAKPELTPFISVGGSLLIVIAAFFLLAILFRKVSPQSNRPLPKEAFECLGRYHLTQKHPLQVLRLGSRIVLVSVMPDGVTTLAEITDPDEVVSFLGLCRRLDANSATEMFRQTVAGISEEELSRPHNRPVVTTRRKTPPAAPSNSFDMYSDPDESLAAILARGRR